MYTIRGTPKNLLLIGEILGMTLKSYFENPRIPTFQKIFLVVELQDVDKRMMSE